MPQVVKYYGKGARGRTLTLLSLTHTKKISCSSALVPNPCHSAFKSNREDQEILGAKELLHTVLCWETFLSNYRPLRSATEDAFMKTSIHPCKMYSAVVLK